MTNDILDTLKLKAHLALSAIHAMPYEAKQVLEDEYRPSYVCYSDGPGASSVTTLDEFAVWASDQLHAYSPRIIVAKYLDDIAYIVAWWTYFTPGAPGLRACDTTKYGIKEHEANLTDVLAAVANKE